MRRIRRERCIADPVLHPGVDLNDPNGDGRLSGYGVYLVELFLDGLTVRKFCMS